jgi:hypothetical protein
MLNLLLQFSWSPLKFLRELLQRKFIKGPKLNELKSFGKVATIILRYQTCFFHDIFIKQINNNKNDVPIGTEDKMYGAVVSSSSFWFCLMMAHV